MNFSIHISGVHRRTFCTNSNYYITLLCLICKVMFLSILRSITFQTTSNLQIVYNSVFLHFTWYILEYLGKLFIFLYNLLYYLFHSANIIRTKSGISCNKWIIIINYLFFILLANLPKLKLRRREEWRIVLRSENWWLSVGYILLFWKSDLCFVYIVECIKKIPIQVIEKHYQLMIVMWIYSVLLK